MTMESPGGRSLSDFTVELDVYSGPYEWLLALILKDELEIFEVPLRELVALYLRSRNPHSPNTLERDTDFAGSAAALILLKSRTLSPALDTGSEGDVEVALSPEELAERLSEYLKIRRGADFLRDRFLSNAGHYPSAHTLPPRPGRLQINPRRLSEAARRTFSRLVEPPVRDAAIRAAVVHQPRRRAVRRRLLRDQLGREVEVEFVRSHSLTMFSHES